MIKLLHKTKRQNLLKAYTGYTGNQTVTEILSYIPTELLNKLSGSQIGRVMNAIDQAYVDGQSNGKMEA